MRQQIVRLVLLLGLWMICSVPQAKGTEHPFVMINAAELATLRAEIQRGGWKSQLYWGKRDFELYASGKGIRANADLWLKRTIEIPARGGHFHHYFCEEGDRLELPKDQQFMPGPYRCPKCGRLYRGEKYEGAVRRLIHGFLAQAARDLALAAQIEHKPEYARKAAEILIKYAGAYPGPHTSALFGGMIYQSLDESMWIIPLAQAYDLIYQDVTAEERAKIETFLRAAAQGIQRCGVAGNWGSWHLSAVGVVGYAIDDAQLIDWATGEFKKQIRNDLGDDGLWPESVHCYHFFPMLAFLYFAEAANHAGVDLYHWEGKPGKSLMSMFGAPLQYAYPNLRLPAINDGWFESFLPADTYELGYARSRNPDFAWVAQRSYASGQAQRSGLWAFLFGSDLPRGSEPQMVSTNFPVLGIATLRSTNGAMLTFHYGPFLGHGHLDKMGFTLFADNKVWSADYGTPGYGSAILPWYQRTPSHNTVLVDGKTQERTQENRALFWQGDPAFEAIQSTTEQAYRGVKHTRTIVRIGDCFIVRDQLLSDQEHAFEFYFHSEGKFVLPGKKETFAAAEPRQWIDDLRQGAAQEEIVARWEEKGSSLALWLGGDAPVIPLTGLCPAESGSRKIPLLIARRQGKAAEFVAVLFPCRKKVAFQVQRQGTAVLVSHGRRQDRVSFAADTGKPDVQRIR